MSAKKIPSCGNSALVKESSEYTHPNTSNALFYQSNPLEKRLGFHSRNSWSISTNIPLILLNRTHLKKMAMEDKHGTLTSLGLADANRCGV